MNKRVEIFFYCCMIGLISAILLKFIKLGDVVGMLISIVTLSAYVTIAISKYKNSEKNFNR